ncbi:uncharacterized protein LOC143822881 [Paroedura picta]|uniref:uncharacterized protein LOC143822881 n=1 Tax=Paroedura picta TaxID=143630 RepID=UPI0040575129
MACVFSFHARTALVLGVLLLLALSFQQVPAMLAGGQAFTGQELQRASAPKAASARWPFLMRRTSHSTPLWRMLGSKPLGAFCKRQMECSTHTCRNGHCADPQVRS